MSTAKSIIGLLIIIAAWGVAAYLAIWVMLVGGMSQLIQALQSTPIVGADVAWGIAKIILCETPAAIGCLGMFIGLELMD